MRVLVLKSLCIGKRCLGVVELAFVALVSSFSLWQLCRFLQVLLWLLFFLLWRGFSAVFRLLVALFMR